MTAYAHKSNDWMNRIFCGDASYILKGIPNHSIDLVVTSPPYYRQRDYNGLGIGNEKTVDAYIEAIADTFEQLVRVVKPTGSIVINIGDKYLNSSLALIPYRFALHIIGRFGVRLVNDITWVKTNPTPRQYDRRLVSSTEPFFHFALSDNYYYDREAFMPAAAPKVNKPTKKLGISYRPKIEESNLTPSQKMLALAELDRAIEDVWKKKIVGFRMKIKGVHAEAFGGNEGGRKMRMERDGFTIIRMHGGNMKRDVMISAVESEKNINHPAIFPVALVGEIIRLMSPPKGIVLDPYIGSGSTAVAAMRENRNYLGIDINPCFCSLSTERAGDGLTI